jgi:transcriptional regulator with XRE-family HTH domain
MTFPEKLKIARTMMGLTQQELAKISGMPHSSIAQFETGAREPSLSSFRKLVVALRVPADYLLDIDIAELWRFG